MRNVVTFDCQDDAIELARLISNIARYIEIDFSVQKGSETVFCSDGPCGRKDVYSVTYGIFVHHSLHITLKREDFGTVCVSVRNGSGHLRLQTDLRLSALKKPAHFIGEFAAVVAEINRQSRCTVAVRDFNRLIVSAFV